VAGGCAAALLGRHPDPLDATGLLPALGAAALEDLLGASGVGEDRHHRYWLRRLADDLQELADYADELRRVRRSPPQRFLEFEAQIRRRLLDVRFALECRARQPRRGMFRLPPDLSLGADSPADEDDEGEAPREEDVP